VTPVPSRDEFSTFVTSRYDSLVRFAYVLVGRPDEATDLAHTALVRLLERWEGLHSVAAAEAYARRAMVNVIADRRRRRDPRPLLVSGAVHSASVTPSTLVDEHLVVWQAVLNLPPQQRAAVVLRYYEDRPAGEIAQILGCSTESVRTHLKRALRRLRTTVPAPTAAEREMNVDGGTG
jgi:RNA polymerase sigma-70 factor (sigma-E family)